MRRLALLFVSLALLSASGAPASADRETAEFLAKRGEKSLREKAWGAAVEFFQKSLAEDEEYLPARLGLAESLACAGKTTEAVDQFRRVAADAEAKKPLPPAWGDLAGKAKRRLTEMDVAAGALEGIVSKYADDLVVLAQKWIRGDPALAERCLRRCLSLKPGHPKATDLLKKLPADVAGRPRALFDGKTLEGWQASSHFRVSDGVMVAEVREGAREVRTETSLEGSFDVICEGRLVESFGVPLLVLTACVQGKENRYQFGFVGEEVFLDDKKGPDDKRHVFHVLFRTLAKDFDVKTWNVYELRFRGDVVTALVNGKVVGTDDRPKDRTGGYVGLAVQESQVEVRRYEVVQR